MVVGRGLPSVALPPALRPNLLISFLMRRRGGAVARAVPRAQPRAGLGTGSAAIPICLIVFSVKEEEDESRKMCK